MSHAESVGTSVGFEQNHEQTETVCMFQLLHYSCMCNILYLTEIESVELPLFICEMKRRRR